LLSISENHTPCANDAAFHPFSDVTHPGEPPSAKMRALQKQWPVDPPSAQQRRIQTLLECLSEQQRSWNVCQEAARAYVAAEEPPYTINFWGHGPQAHKNKPLWTLIGQALDSGGAAGYVAIEVLDQMRARKP
jgi:hypothetical protein